MGIEADRVPEKALSFLAKFLGFFRGFPEGARLISRSELLAGIVVILGHLERVSPEGLIVPPNGTLLMSGGG